MLECLEQYKIIPEVIYYCSIIVALLAYLLNKKKFYTENEREKNLIVIDLLKIFYQNILPKYEKIETILENKNLENYMPYFEIGGEIKLDNENLMAKAKNYCKWLKEDANNFEQYFNLSKQILGEFAIFSLGLKMQSKIANLEIIEQTISDKYIIIFERIFPILIQEPNKKIYKECIDFYNELKTKKNRRIISL